MRKFVEKEIFSMSKFLPGSYANWESWGFLAHTHTHVYIYIYIWVERKKERKNYTYENRYEPTDIDRYERIEIDWLILTESDRFVAKLNVS